MVRLADSCLSRDASRADKCSAERRQESLRLDFGGRRDPHAWNLRSFQTTLSVVTGDPAKPYWLASLASLVLIPNWDASGDGETREPACRRKRLLASLK